MERLVNNTIVYELKSLFINISDVLSNNRKKIYTFLYNIDKNKYNYIYYNIMMIIYLKNNIPSSDIIYSNIIINLKYINSIEKILKEKLINDKIKFEDDEIL